MALDLATGATHNAAAWVLANNITNENGKPLDFRRHKFLVDFYMDQTPEIVCIKCSQIGFSTTAIIKSAHLCNYKKANVIYLLPSKSVVKDFVTPKVDPLINTNPALRGMMGVTDNLGLKSFGTGKDQRFLYFRSSWDESSGIAISAHVLVADENDRSNQKAISTYRTRLDAALLDRPDLGYVWRFSNPTIEGYGTDEIYGKSDAKVWMIKCGHCNHFQEMKYPENINFETQEYICIKCQRNLTVEDRTRGEWVKRYFGRNISGYRISQMIAPWIPASKIIADSLGDQSIFYNFTLGQAYTSKDIQITRDSLTKCLSPDYNPRTNVAIGVDNGIIKHYVIGNKYGIFRVGSTESWQEIENLRNQYDAVMVCDANPYPTPVYKLVQKYRGKVFAQYYEEDKKQMGTIRYGEGEEMGIVKSDRTKLIDSFVADVNSQDVLFNMSLTELENQEYIQHCLNIYRVVEESAMGIKKGVWKTIEGKPDHLLHASCYFKVALQQTLTVGGVAHAPPPRPKMEITPTYATPDGRQVSGFDFDKFKASLDKPKQKTWRQL